MVTSKKLFKLAIIVSIAMILGGVIGFYLGIELTIKEVVKIAQLMGLSINKTLIDDAIFKYNNHLSVCYQNST